MFVKGWFWTCKHACVFTHITEREGVWIVDLALRENSRIFPFLLRGKMRLLVALYVQEGEQSVNERIILDVRACMCLHTQQGQRSEGVS